MKAVLFLFAVWLSAPSLLIAGEDDPLDQRAFNSSLSETRNGVVAKKVISDLIRFRNGKMSSTFVHEKFGFKWLRYRIIKDTSYIDETQTQVRLLQAEAFATDEDNVTVVLEFTVLEWDIDGTMKVTKNDRLRKYYDLAGREKGGKPKKEKKTLLTDRYGREMEKQQH
jgi:hypothetical protein